MTALDPLVSVFAITELPLISDQAFDLVVVGGGASGFMAAITAAEKGLKSIAVLEGSSKTLEKVRISGGGRCNVTHACWDPNDLVNNYPRGKLPLLSCFSRFASGDAVAWFAEHGLNLIEEEDGRMFPVENSSSAVINCLREFASKNGVRLFTNFFVNKLEYINGKFVVLSKNKFSFTAKKVLLATGGNPSGKKLLESLGHNVIKPVPSLFAFSLASDYLTRCAGISIDSVESFLIIGDKTFNDQGRILITHKGLSGPLVLKLSSFAARDLYLNKYRAELIINWIGKSYSFVKDLMKEFRLRKPSLFLSNSRPFLEIPKRLWLILLQKSGISQRIRWADLSKKSEDKLINELIKSKYIIQGKGPFGEEFVMAGGVSLSEVDLRKMESKLCPGLHFSGEILNIDGLTGGFNFQLCWTSGWLAGNSIANDLMNSS